MKSIELIHLYIENFKGIRLLEINFGKETFIYGDNATGKTTIADAFFWLLFDKDSTNRKDFNIKTLDCDSNAIPGLDHKVIATLSIDGVEKVLCKNYKEKWTKTRGSADKTMTGHETEYYINDVPLKESEYKKAISEIIDESVFRILTDPTHFSATLKWNERRATLLKIFGDANTADVLALIPDSGDLAAEFQTEPKLENIIDKIKARRKKLNQDIQDIPTRIDEANRGIAVVDIDAAQRLLNDYQDDLKDIEAKIESNSITDPEKEKLQKEIRDLNSSLAKMEAEAEAAAESKKKQIIIEADKVVESVHSLARSIAVTEEKIKVSQLNDKNYTEEIEKAANMWIAANDEEFFFDETECKCPTCKRLLDKSDIEAKKAALLANFNEEKANKLKRIEALGNQYRETKEKNLEFIKNCEKSIEDTKAVISAKGMEADSLKSILESISVEYPALYESLKAQENALREELKNMPVKDNAEILNKLKEEKRDCEYKINQVKANFYIKENNDKLLARIEDLKTEERTKAAQLAQADKILFLCEQFIVKKVSLLDERINSAFKNVTFKLFNKNINGGIEETCEALINGVPFADANNAAKINAGIDIINTLSSFYNVTAPIFIDNREAVNVLIPTSSQVINLIVSTDKNLRIAV